MIPTTAIQVPPQPIAHVAPAKPVPHRGGGRRSPFRTALIADEQGAYDAPNTLRVLVDCESSDRQGQLLDCLLINNGTLTKPRILALVERELGAGWKVADVFFPMSEF